MLQAEQIPVLIVGGGPVGLALSIDLSWRGISHILVDRGTRAARADHPRMDQVGIRSMEHFRRLGIVPDIEGAGFPRNQDRDVVFATGVLDLELAREPFEADATRPPPQFSPQKHELCPQNYLDPALQIAAERSALADIRYDNQLVQFHDADGRVRAELEHLPTGQRYKIDATYVAGCDGSGSAVAAHLQIGAEAPRTLANSTNIFIHSTELRLRAAPGTYRYILIGPDGVWASMVNMDGRDTWRLQVLGGHNCPIWTDKRARAEVEHAIGADCSYELVSTVPWTRRELIADRFAAGRYFLVGDAAHQFSPTGGYGMNTGLVDAMDLSWKLAAMLEGWGGPNLLASYEVERRPVAIRNAQRATVNFHNMRSISGDPAVLELTPAGQAVRARIGREIRERMHEEWDSMGIHLGYSYAGSPIVFDDDESRTDTHPAHFQQSAAPGARAPHVWLGDGRSTLDLFGRGFVLLQFDPKVEIAPLAMAAAERGVPLRCERIDNAAAASLYGRKLVLVRPDGHVAMRCDELPEDAAAMIDRVRGAGACCSNRSTTEVQMMPLLLTR